MNLISDAEVEKIEREASARLEAIDIRLQADGGWGGGYIDKRPSEDILSLITRLKVTEKALHMASTGLVGHGIVYGEKEEVMTTPMLMSHAATLLKLNGK